MKELHPLLLRQLKKSGVDLTQISSEISELLGCVTRSYNELDKERYTTERSHEIASNEMRIIREKLNKEREYLHSIMSEGFCIVNSSWQVTNLNKEAERILGLNFEDASGQCIDDILKVYVDADLKVPISLEILKDNIQKGVQFTESRVYIKLDDNRTSPISYSLNPLPFLEGKLFAGAVFVLRDIAEHVKFEKSLQDAMLEAKKSSEVKSLFLANMSHEIRTPLNGILGMLQLLDSTEMSSLQREYLQVALTSGDNLLKLIGDILDFTKIESNSLSIEEVDFDLRQDLAAIESLFKAELEKKHISYGLIIAPGVPQHIHADSFRIRQVILNLISNAIKFTPDYGEVITRVTLVSDSELKIAVTDNGVGISPDALGILFQPFTQADSSITRRFGGTGLGLVICKKLVEKMHGHIGVESVEHHGSTFSFTFIFKSVTIEPQTEQPVIAINDLDIAGDIYPQQLITPVDAERSSRRSVHRVHDCGENREGNPPTLLRATDGQANPENSAVKGITTETSISPSDAHQHPVMVVDDNPINRMVVGEMLKKLNCEVMTATNGQEAIDLLKSTPVEIVFMDCHMPVMDGFEATLKIRAAERENQISYHGKPTKIVALTADAFQTSKEKCLSLGMDDFIPKPFKIDHLQGVIQKMLESK
ncbi:MAG: ATP-binding protein [Gammaproteobacteria bacterium]